MISKVKTKKIIKMAARTLCMNINKKSNTVTNDKKFKKYKLRQK